MHTTLLSFKFTHSLIPSSIPDKPIQIPIIHTVISKLSYHSGMYNHPLMQRNNPYQSVLTSYIFFTNVIYKVDLLERALIFTYPLWYLLYKLVLSISINFLEIGLDFLFLLLKLGHKVILFLFH